MGCIIFRFRRESRLPKKARVYGTEVMMKYILKTTRQWEEVGLDKETCRKCYGNSNCAKMLVFQSFDSRWWEMTQRGTEPVCPIQYYHGTLRTAFVVPPTSCEYALEHLTMSEGENV